MALGRNWLEEEVYPVFDVFGSDQKEINQCNAIIDFYIPEIHLDPCRRLGLNSE